MAPRAGLELDRRVLPILSSVLDPGSGDGTGSGSGGGGGGDGGTTGGGGAGPTASPTRSEVPSSATTTTATVTGQISSSTSNAGTRTSQPNPTITRTSAPASTERPTESSVTLLTSSITSDGRVIPVTLTQTVVVVNPSSTSNASTSKTSSTNGGLIGGVVGGVVGGVAVLALLIALAVVLKRRKERTGSAYFLCFGARPKYGEKDDLQHSAAGAWPTFDPSTDASHSRGFSRGRGGAAFPQATLPDVDTNDELAEHIASEGYDPSEVHYSASGNSLSHNGGSPRADAMLSFGHGGASTAGGRSPAWPEPVGFYASAPDYSHLDPPDMREARAREAAATAAAGAFTDGRHQRQFSRSGDEAYSPSISSPPTHFGSTTIEHGAGGNTNLDPRRPVSGTSTVFNGSGSHGHENSNKDVADGSDGSAGPSLHLANP